MNDDVFVEQWTVVKGNPDTGEIVLGQSEFSENYDGPDYRVEENRKVARTSSQVAGDRLT